jgi:hypothetical protein
MDHVINKHIKDASANGKEVFATTELQSNVEKINAASKLN